MNLDVKIGDKVVVYGYYPPATIEDIIIKPGLDITLMLDWGELGKSKVKYHDKNSIWFKYNDAD